MTTMYNFFTDNSILTSDMVFTFTKGTDRRAHHNALERKRRDHIKDSFVSLRDAIPEIAGEKVGTEMSMLFNAR